MADEQSFKKAIVANLTDNAPRLIFADWLDEQGHSGEAEFLRSQTALARMPKKDKRSASLRKRLKQLRPALDSEWLSWWNSLRYRTAFAALARPLTARDGVSEKRVAQHERRLGVRLPRVLRDYYLLAGRHPFNQAHNRLLSPDEWDRESGKLVFLVENQGVALWGVKINDPANDDPPVYFRYDSDFAEDAKWRQTNPRCSDFLATHLYYQAVYGYGMKYRGNAYTDTPQALARLEETWP
jgi:uncharacterized protein (TIGR02996 family)